MQLVKLVVKLLGRVELTLKLAPAAVNTRKLDGDAGRSRRAEHHINIAADHSDMTVGTVGRGYHLFDALVENNDAAAGKVGVFPRDICVKLPRKVDIKLLLGVGSIPHLGNAVAGHTRKRGLSAAKPFVHKLRIFSRGAYNGIHRLGRAARNGRKAVHSAASHAGADAGRLRT